MIYRIFLFEFFYDKIVYNFFIYFGRWSMGILKKKIKN